MDLEHITTFGNLTPVVYGPVLVKDQQPCSPYIFPSSDPNILYTSDLPPPELLSTQASPLYETIMPPITANIECSPSKSAFAYTYETESMSSDHKPVKCSLYPKDRNKPKTVLNDKSLYSPQYHHCLPVVLNSRLITKTHRSKFTTGHIPIQPNEKTGQYDEETMFLFAQHYVIFRANLHFYERWIAQHHYYYNENHRLLKNVSQQLSRSNTDVLGKVRRVITEPLFYNEYDKENFLKVNLKRAKFCTNPRNYNKRKSHSDCLKDICDQMCIVQVKMYFYCILSLKKLYLKETKLREQYSEDAFFSHLLSHDNWMVRRATQILLINTTAPSICAFCPYDSDCNHKCPMCDVCHITFEDCKFFYNAKIAQVMLHFVRVYITNFEANSYRSEVFQAMREVYNLRTCSDCFKPVYD
uniref:Uncharacterized protein n=1 Tax=Ranid herpesvirus 4 TaxID=2849006 RepID=A0A8F3CIM3_9VIRU|nr:MAG: hypothetical protein [Ranid herpesvirus 4]